MPDAEIADVVLRVAAGAQDANTNNALNAASRF
jgi:hypothetical protein